MYTDALIVGGGVTGLSAAYELQEQARQAGLPLSYTLLERGPRLGGKVVTLREQGFVIEGGPDSFISQKPEAAELCRRLGLGTELIGTNDAARRVFVASGGRLEAVPEGVMLIVPTRIWPFVRSGLVSWPGKLRMGLELLIPPRAGEADESVGAFVRRRLGREALAKIAGPMLSGIHSADPEEQSLLATFPRLRELERRHGSLIRGMLAARAPASRQAPAGPRAAFLSLREGTAQLTEALERALTGRVVTGAQAMRIERAQGALGDPLYRVCTADGACYETPVLLLSTPAGVSAALLDGLSPRLAAGLRAIRYSSTANISLGFRRAEVGHPLDGFGVMIPRHEPFHLSACTWSSSKLSHRAPGDAVLLRCFISGEAAEPLLQLPDDDLVDLACADLRRLIGLEARPLIARVFRWPQANPQYDVGHLERVRALRALLADEGLAGLLLTGSAYDGVGVPDCIRQGCEAARSALALLRPRLAVSLA